LQTCKEEAYQLMAIKINIGSMISDLIKKHGFVVAANRLYSDHKKYIKDNLLVDYPWLDNEADEIIRKVIFYLCKHMLGS